MNRTPLAGGLLLAALLIVPSPVGPAAARDLAGSAPGFVPGRLVVRFQPGAAPRAGLDLLGAGGVPVDVGRWAPLVPASAGMAGRAGFADRLSRTVRIRLTPGEDPAAAAAAWRRQPGVEYAAPVHLIPLLDGSPEGTAGRLSDAIATAGSAGPASALVPSDPLLSSQWQHEAIGSFAAWDLSAGDSSVVIAIVDTGVDGTHPDLQANLRVNRAEADGLAGVDDDGNGYVDDVAGYDFTDVPEVDGAGDFKDRDPDPVDDVGHGTWVTGVAGAAGNNGLGGAGVAWRARFMPLRAGFRPRTGFTLGYLAEDDAAAAIAYAADNGADVLNLSFGDVIRAPLLEDAVGYALERGLVVVAAAGNSGTGEPFYPASLPGVLAVGAEDREGNRASFSTWGSSVTLLAPGEGLLTTDLGGGYASRSGTSLASPVVAGAAAILRSLHPDWPASRIVAVLRESARLPAAGADAHDARLLRLDAAVGREPGAVISLDGIAEGDGFDREVTIRGTVQGRLVRGWRVQARRPGAAWRSLAAELRRPAVDELLAQWDVSGEPEGTVTLRVEALGTDDVVAHRDVTIGIDHTPPQLLELEVLPVISGDGWGVRAVARTDEPVFGRMVVTAGASGPLEFDSVVSGTTSILGVNGPLSLSLAGPIPVELAFTNGAGLVTRRSVLLDPSGSAVAGATIRGSAPGGASCLPVLADLNGDGRADLVMEMPAAAGATYGEVVAFNHCPGCPEPFTRIWDSGAEFLPRDAADFDGDGRIELLGLAVQQIRVYAAGGPVDYPGTLTWNSNDAWASRFIPAATGAGCDIVASRDTGIRIYRAAGPALELRQVISNPTTGVNTISPEIALVHADGDGRVSLATLDGDNDLIVVTRDAAGVFAPRWSARLDGDLLPLVAPADLDGDGLDEIVLVEGVGGIPSPASGLREGFYRLHAFKAQADGSFAKWLSPPGAAGFFPGNPVSLEGFDLDGDGRDELWWNVNGALHRLQLSGGALRPVESWVWVAAGRPARGDLAAVPGGGPTIPVLVFPGWGSTGDPADLVGAMFRGIDGAALPKVVDLRVEEAAARGDLVDARLSWSGASPPYELRRWPATGNLEPVTATLGIMTTEWWDSSLVAGTSYAYTVTTAGDHYRWIPPLVMAARPRDAVTGVVASPGSVEVAWEHPVLATERARVLLLAPAEGGSAGPSGAAASGESADPETLAVSSTLLDRGGNRLRITPATSLEAGRRYAWKVTGYLSDARIPLTGTDAAGEFEVPPATSRLTLRSARLTAARALLLEFEPAAPVNPDPALIQVEPGIHPVSVVARDARTLLVGIDAGTPLLAGRGYTVRLLSGLVGPAGESLEPGVGDALAFRADPVVYPNPVRPRNREVRFDWLAEGSRVEVFSMDGRAIWAGDCGAAGWLTWDLTDREGRRVSPGVYLFRVDGSMCLNGKLAVVR